MPVSQLQTRLSQPCARRDALHWAIALATAGTSGVFQPTTAARGWCRSDPLVLIGDTLAYIISTAPREIRRAVTGPTEIVVTVPAGIQAKLVAAGSDFGEGETIRFEYSDEAVASKSGVAVKVEARVPASTDLPIGLEFSRRTRGGIKNPSRASGRTNRWVTLSARLQADRHKS